MRKALLMTGIVVGLLASSGMVVAVKDKNGDPIDCPSRSGNVTIGILGALTGFSPVCVQINSGATITWSNNDQPPPPLQGATHIPADDEDPPLGPGHKCFRKSINPGQSASVTFFYEGANENLSVVSLGGSDCNDAIDEEGEVLQTNANEAVIFYICQAHPDTMNGIIVVNSA